MPHQAEVKSFGSVDPVWQKVKEEAEQAVEADKVIAGLIYNSILNHQSLEESLAYHLSQRLDHSDVDASVLNRTFNEIINNDEAFRQTLRIDMAAVFERDPACNRLLEPLLYFKGFHALQTHRFAHHLWLKGSIDFAFYLQSQSSRVFGVDIHPKAKIGSGIMFDHATALVIGETAEVGDYTSILHNVTLGGSGKETGDRHPKIGTNVMIGAGSKILGNITVGSCARVAAGSVVLEDVPKETTVAGVPAKVIGAAGCNEPARTMNQLLNVVTENEKNEADDG
ncbi:MAG: serine O-acetyltransferase [Rhizobiales bacterium]|nr:serine O-acetyltransferase [Hyphomicrobiales bacterium]